MRLIIAIIGHVSAGKSTTAQIVARTLNATYIAADDIVRDLGYSNELRPLVSADKLQRVGLATTAELARRFAAVPEHETIIFDATTTVPSLRDLLESERRRAHIVLLHCDEHTWRARELQRTDRFPLTEDVRLTSLAAGHALRPDYLIDTSHVEPGDIATTLLTWLREHRSTLARQ